MITTWWLRAVQTADSNKVAEVKDQVKGVASPPKAPDNLKTTTDQEPCLGNKLGYGSWHLELTGAKQN